MIPDSTTDLTTDLITDLTTDDLTPGHTSAEEEYFGTQVVTELKEGGASIPVTEENKLEYVNLVTEHRMTGAIRAQIEAFCKVLKRPATPCQSIKPVQNNARPESKSWTSAWTSDLTK